MEELGTLFEQGILITKASLVEMMMDQRRFTAEQRFPSSSKKS